MAEVAFIGVTKVFGDGTRAVDRLDLEIADGEFMVFVGPSGCGKTTALRMVAGLEEITEGAVRIGSRVVNDLSPKARDIAMVFQSYALYPHLTVYDNIAFALKMKKVPKDEIHRRVTETARILDLQPYLKRKPRALSGGQRQRVAMGRAIVRQPQTFLMDEPLSNLDAKLRVQMRGDIKKLQSDLRVTTIYVTHDQVEAMTMGDRVAVMRKGELQQVAGPEELYQRPRNVFVAGFIGSPAMNMLEASVERRNGALEVVVGETRIEVDDETLAAHRGLASYENRTIVLGIRPESLDDAALLDGDRRPRLRGRAELREALGPEVLLHFSVAARQAVTDEVRELAEDVGDDRALEQLSGGAQASTTLVGRFRPQTRIREGDTIEVAIDERALHFFDPQSGVAIYREPADGRST
jgi:multiple sugar transport system ATP-binding protein